MTGPFDRPEVVQAILTALWDSSKIMVLDQATLATLLERARVGYPTVVASRIAVDYGQALRPATR